MNSAANPPSAAPRAHHFAGTLLEAAHACTGGLWQISLRLEDDDGRSQYVYLAPGRGDAGALACGLQLAGLTIGQRYHGSATMHRAGEHHDYYTGRVVLATDQRRPVLLDLATRCGRPAAASGATA